MSIYKQDFEYRLRGYLRILLQFGAFVAAIIFIPDLVSPYIKSDFWYVFIDEIIYMAAAFTTVGLAVRYLDRDRLTSYGFLGNRIWLRNFIVGYITGFVVITFLFGLGVITGFVKINSLMYSQTDPSFFVAFIVRFTGYIFVAITEEVIFRGYQFKNFREIFERTGVSKKTAEFFALISTSFIFGVVHSLNPNVTILSLINLIAVGFLFGYAFIVTRSLALPIGLHAAWNFVMGNVYGFPVSGFNASVSLFKVEMLGPELISGRSFGPEGGVVIFAAIISGFVILSVIHKKKSYFTERLRELGWLKFFRLS